eukprot:398896-Lingulodinium_polyedra.AAC.1
MRLLWPSGSIAFAPPAPFVSPDRSATFERAPPPSARPPGVRAPVEGKPLPAGGAVLSSGRGRESRRFVSSVPAR